MNTTIILCPVPFGSEKMPSHLLFGSDYFEDMAKTNFDCNVKVIYLPYKPLYTFWGNLYLSFFFLFKIIFKKHDVLYYTTDPNNLILIALLKVVKIYRKPIFAWKYIALHGDGIKREALKVFYYAFEKIFMITEKHVAESIKSGIIKSDQIIHIKWGGDVTHIDKLAKRIEISKHNFTFISTGKAYRDFHTLCKAFEGINNANLIIYTEKVWGGVDYENVLYEFYSNPTIKICYADKINLSNLNIDSINDYLYLEMLNSDCSIVCCKKVNFGVGYTQILDSLSCKLPVIITYNIDNPLNVDELGVGISVPVGDIDALRNAMIKIMNNKIESKIMGEVGRKLIEDEYDIKKTSQIVLKIILTK